ncbi:hypothetical protein K438DRAFT_1871007 [Mycena galopus ATCC 62051]|nr:hypothetical protein K438DRAFT_1871007 [Mycena galopus ATCC 62051]
MLRKEMSGASRTRPRKAPLLAKDVKTLFHIWLVAATMPPSPMLLLVLYLQRCSFNVRRTRIKSNSLKACSSFASMLKLALEKTRPRFLSLRSCRTEAPSPPARK